jgi:hypothetical protein
MLVRPYHVEPERFRQACLSAHRVDGADEAAQKGADLMPARPLARAQQRGDKNAPPHRNDNRLKAVIVLVGVEQAQLLPAMHPVESVVDIEQDALRHLPERGAVLLDRRAPQRSSARVSAGFPAARWSIASTIPRPRATDPSPA